MKAVTVRGNIFIAAVVLLIGVIALLAVSGYAQDQLDQEQTEDQTAACAIPPSKYVQNFRPSLTILTRVELKVDKMGTPSDSMTLSPIGQGI